MRRLCIPCAHAWGRWLDYRLPVVLSITHGSGAARDATPAGIRERQESRYRMWRDTIRWNQDHIRELCEQGKHRPYLALDIRV